MTDTRSLADCLLGTMSSLFSHFALFAGCIGLAWVLCCAFFSIPSFATACLRSSFSRRARFLAMFASRSSSLFLMSRLSFTVRRLAYYSDLGCIWISLSVFTSCLLCSARSCSLSPLAIVSTRWHGWNQRNTVCHNICHAFHSKFVWYNYTKSTRPFALLKPLVRPVNPMTASCVNHLVS
jgi:hypothetical protein